MKVVISIEFSPEDEDADSWMAKEMLTQSRGFLRKCAQMAEDELRHLLSQPAAESKKLLVDAESQVYWEMSLAFRVASRKRWGKNESRD